MAKKHKCPTTTTADLVAEYFNQRDEQLMQALVTAGAFVALADGYVKDVERHELVSYVDGNDLVPTIAQREIIEAFDNRVREIEDRGSANVIVDAFRPLVGRSPSSFLLRVAERVAAADGYLHTNEVQSIEIVRLIVTNPPGNGSQSSGNRTYSSFISRSKHCFSVSLPRLRPPGNIQSLSRRRLTRKTPHFLRPPTLRTSPFSVGRSPFKESPANSIAFLAFLKHAESIRARSHPVLVKAFR